MEITERTIDIKAVFRGKSPKLANAIPGFIYMYLRRLLHEDEINTFLWDHRNIYGLDFASASIDALGARPKPIGLTEELLEGRCLVAANHPLGGADGLSLLCETGKFRPDVMVPTNDILMFLPNLRSLFMSINKHGSNADNIRVIEESFNSDRLILYFPAGLVSRKQKEGIVDLDWKITFIKKAVRHQRDIIPVHIGGQNSRFFYNLALWRKRLGIKSNIEMLFLVNEMFKFRDKDIEIRFGQRIPWQTFDKTRKPAEWAQAVRQHVYRIGESDDPGSLPFNPQTFTPNQ